MESPKKDSFSDPNSTYEECAAVFDDELEGIDSTDDPLYSPENQERLRKGIEQMERILPIDRGRGIKMGWVRLADKRHDKERPLLLYVKERTKYNIDEDERRVSYTTVGFHGYDGDFIKGNFWNLVIPYRPFENMEDPFSQGCFRAKSFIEDCTEICERPNILLEEIKIEAWRYLDDTLSYEDEQTEKTNAVGGMLRKYADPSKWPLEEGAFEKAMAEKHAIK